MMSQTIKINYHYRLQLVPILDISNRAQEDGHSYTKKKNFEKTQKTKKIMKILNPLSSLALYPRPLGCSPQAQVSNSSIGSTGSKL